MSLIKAGLMALLCGLAAGPVCADEAWKTLTPQPSAVVIDSNPMQGFYGWEGPGIVPTATPSPEHYFRVTWAEIEPRAGVYDFSRLDQALAKAGPAGRIAFGVMTMDTCCSQPDGVDVPAYLKDKPAKGFWIDGDASSKARHVFVPDWNDPYFLARWQALWAAIGARYDGDARIAWVDLRGYGNWGEGHLAGANAYHWTQIPYDDPKVNVNGARPGTEASRFAMVDAIANALPNTRLIAMTDDKAVLVHALKLTRALPVGMKRDSWGSLWFASGFTPDTMSAEDKALVLDRWKTAPLVVESYGWTKVFEAGLDGITGQIEAFHVSAIGNGGFNVNAWSQLSKDQQAALIKAGNRAGYRYTPVAVRWRRTAACPLQVAIDWRNDGVAPVYDPWQVELSATGGDAASVPLPAILPGETQTTDSCLNAGEGNLRIRVTDTRNALRAMTLPLAGGDAKTGYDLGHLDSR